MQIGIIGGGFCGSLVSYHCLSECSDHTLSIEVIEPSYELGRGVAYASPFDCHLLNVPAGKMSAISGDPDHFLRWLSLKGFSYLAGDFVPRNIFGEYLSSIMKEPQRKNPTRLRHCRARATQVLAHQGGFRVSLDNGRSMYFDRLVLALGNTVPAPLPAFSTSFQESNRYLENPWDFARLSSIPRAASIIVFGSGLTMIDSILALNANGHTGPIVFTSRHGLSPLAHGRSDSSSFCWQSVSKLTPEMVLKEARILRRESPDDWISFIDSLRPVTQPLWRSLSDRHKRRFLRHLRPYWDVHRHRVAPEVIMTFESLKRTGRVKQISGKLLSVDLEDNANIATVAKTDAGRNDVHITTDFAINCTGPCSDIEFSRIPLLKQLLVDGVIQKGPLSIGIASNPKTGAVRNHDGSFSDGLFVIGSLRKGELWESTAIPELREQAALLATSLLSDQPLEQPGNETYGDNLEVSPVS